jgi:drug/metabolite transporter (DMT)-like permease
MKRRTKAYIYLLLVAAIWGSAGPVIKFTLSGLSPHNFLTYRFFVSSLASILALPFLKVKLPKDKNTLLFLLSWGFINSILSLGLLFIGLEKTTVVDMSIITLASPLLVTFAGAKLLGDHITKQEKIGTTIAVLGIFLTIIEPMLRSHTNGNLTGNFFVGLSLVVNTVSSVMVKKLTRKKISPNTMIATSFWIGLVSITTYTLFKEGPAFFNQITSLSLPYHLGVLFMALVSGNFAYTLWVKGQKSIEISEASLFTYLHPVFAIPIAILWLKETLSLSLILGAVVIIIGLSIAETKKKLIR